MGKEFNGPTDTGSGAALQAAWLGSTAARHVVTGASRAHMTVSSCTLSVSRALFGAGQAVTMGRLHKATGYAYNEISACLAKLVQTGMVRKLPPPDGKRKGASYRWVSDEAPRRRYA